MRIIKPLIIIASCVLFGANLYAQEKTLSIEEVQEKVNTLFSASQESVKNKNYQQAIRQCEEMFQILALLPKETQEESDIIYTKSVLYYNMACYSSLEKNKNKAFDYLTQAIDLGYKDYQNMKQDKDFENIRNDKRFAPLLERVRKEGDYIYILQQAAKYQRADTTGLPHFTYQPATASMLKHIRTTFKLDSIAGTGDETSKMINILAWLHNTIRHDGSHYTICEWDAIDLYNYSKANNQGINCRMMAIMLHECYLSMGFASRYVTCLPQDPNDPDCHVINCVYSKTLNKWLWMDPTFNAYLKDENGNLLSIEEVRERIIADQPIVLNNDANWNNEDSQTKEHYIDRYMAKNLYWIQCPAASCFNPESPYRNERDTFIALVPPGYQPKSRVRNSITSDPAYFWQAPEK